MQEIERLHKINCSLVTAAKFTMRELDRLEKYDDDYTPMREALTNALAIKFDDNGIQFEAVK